MYELTLGNWTPIARYLLEDVNEVLGGAAIVFKLTMGFSVIAVINGCFIKETFKYAEQDDLLMIMAKDKDRKVHMEKMLKLLALADTKGDGTLTRQEFINVCKDPEVDKWLGAQGLRVTDAGAIFDLIDTGEGLIHKEELVVGARKLQGTARSLDVARNHVTTARNHTQIVQLLKMTHDRFDSNAQITRDRFEEHASSTFRALEPLSPTIRATPDPPFVPDSIDVKDEFARLANQIAELKSVFSTYLGPRQPPTIETTQAPRLETKAPTELKNACLF